MTNGFALQQVADFLAEYRECFSRRDQVRWAAVYIQGLISGLQRKNIENIAAYAGLSNAGGNIKQALQNFIHQSPWDEDELWRRQRASLAGRIGRAHGLFVIREVPFPKRGRHSVGVQRQFSIALGRKINCQIALAIHYVSSAGHAPLALRLYLPKNWIDAPVRLEAVGVPIGMRQSTGKLQVALELLDQLRAEAFPGKYLAAPGFNMSDEIRAELGKRGFDFIGLEDRQSGRAIPLRKFLRLVQADWQWMNDRLGLGHFEGRSWRGFHHHACLVALAFALTSVPDTQDVAFDPGRFENLLRPLKRPLVK
jgi:SRSO17 transposase